jgi:hypothetical protein
MAKGKNVHVVPSGNGWAVKQEGKATPVSQHRSQRTAIESGTSTAKANHSELLIHRPTGEIRDRNSYGNDPKNRKG